MLTSLWPLPWDIEGKGQYGPFYCQLPGSLLVPFYAFLWYGASGDQTQDLHSKQRLQRYWNGDTCSVFEMFKRCKHSIVSTDFSLFHYKTSIMNLNLNVFQYFPVLHAVWLFNNYMLFVLIFFVTSFRNQFKKFCHPHFSRLHSRKQCLYPVFSLCRETTYSRILTRPNSPSKSFPSEKMTRVMSLHK